MKEIIENVKQTIEQKKILWAYPIANKLQQYHYTLAIKWAIQCIQIYSSEIKSKKFSQLYKYIHQLMEEQNVLTSSQCLEISREIWYSPEREEIQTAIARLWGSISNFKYAEEDGELHSGVMEITVAVELVLPDISDYHLLDRYLEAAVRICEEHESQNLQEREQRLEELRQKIAVGTEQIAAGQGTDGEAVFASF
jgi:hypothetical protein